MNQYIDSVLDTIDSIDAITTESDIAISCAMLGSYAKAELILEHYTGDDVSEFSIFKEAEELPEDVKKYNDEHHFARKKADGTDESTFSKIIWFIPRIFTFIFKKIAGLFKKDGSDTAQMKADAEAVAKDPESGSILDKVLNLSEADLNTGTIAKILGVATAAVGAGVVVRLKNVLTFKFSYGLSIAKESVPFRVKSRFDYKKLTEIINVDIFGDSGLLNTLTTDVTEDLNDQAIENIVKKCDEFKKKVDEFLKDGKTGSEEDLGTIAEIADAFIKARDQMRDKPNKLQEAQKHVSDVIKKIQDDKEKNEKPKNIGKLSDAMKEIASRIDKLFTSFKHFNGAVGDLAGIANTVRKLKREGTDTTHRDLMNAASGKNKKTLRKAKALADDIIKLAEEHDTTPEGASEPVDNAKAVEDKAKKLGGIRNQAKEMADNAKNDSGKKRALVLLVEDLDEIIDRVIKEDVVASKFSNIGILINGAPANPENANDINDDTKKLPENPNGTSTEEKTPLAEVPENGTGSGAGGNGDLPVSDDEDTSAWDRIQYYIPDTPYYRNYW